MWEGLQNIPHLNYNPGGAMAEGSTNNSGIYDPKFVKNYV